MGIGGDRPQCIDHPGDTTLICDVEAKERKSLKSSSCRVKRIQGRSEAIDKVETAIPKAPTIFNAEGDKGEAAWVSVAKPATLLDGRTLVSGIEG